MAMLLRKPDEWIDILQKEYIDNKKSSLTIAKEYGCGSTTVYRWLKRLGFETRGVADTLRGVPLSEAHKKAVSESLKGINTWMKGRKLSSETKRKLKLSSTGRKHTEESKKKMSENRKGMKFSKSHCEAISKAKVGTQNGSNHWNWQGGITPDSDRIRRSRDYKAWRLAVYKKDGFTCVGCGDSRGRNLEAHHKLSFANYPDERFNVDNGVTLCTTCHAEIHPELGFVGRGKQHAEAIGAALG